ncbi:MAG: hypothetical protein IKI76_03930 [Selenomonadaceae bacterium]|nr:hypothetical protein [Selenomonadaceae bacterium]
MAEDRSVGGLFLRLGLSLSELETGFVNASQTIAANINRLNREAELVRIRSEIEIAGLDETADAERILQVRQEALNRQMEIQRDRVRILNAELQNLIRTQGENSVAVQRATTTLERARLALANMERQSRNLNDSSGETNSIFGELNDMLPSMPTKLQAVGMAFGAITAGIGAAGAAVNELREEFKELQNQAYELNMPVPDTRKFLREMRLAGGDIGDFEGYIRGITDAWVKGEYDDPEFIALRKYGAEITNATGRLKDFKDLTEEVYQAWLKADAAGEGIEFLQLTGGEAGVRDAIQYFQRLKEAREDAAKIFQAELDDKQLHEFDRAMNLVEEQSKELKAALGDIFIPAAQSAAENFFNVLHDGTEYLVENKNEIQRWGYITAETFSTISDKIKEWTSYQMPDTGEEKVDKMLGGLQWRMSEFNEQALWGDRSPWSKIFLKLPSDILNSFGIIERADEKLKEFNGELENTGEKINEIKDELENVDDNPLSQYAMKRVQQFKDELEDLRTELDFDNEYDRALAQADLWKDRELADKLQVSSEERLAIEELYATKVEQINEEKERKLSEIRQRISAADRTELENKIADIEKEKESWIQAGMEKVEAEGLAQKQLSDYVTNAQKDLNSQLQALYQTELENRLEQIEKERQAWIDKCGDEVKATQKAEQEKADAQRNAAMNVIRQQAKEYEAYQKGGLAGLQAYKMADLKRSGVNLDYLNMTPQQLQQFQQANQLAEKGLMPQFMTETDKAMYREQWQQSYQQRQKEFDDENYAIVNGIKTTMSEALGGIPITLKLDDDSVLNLSPNGQSATMRDYETDNNGRIQSMTETNFELPSIVSEVSQSLSEMQPIIQSASDSLGDLPIAIQGITENLSSIEIPQFADMNQPLEEVTVRLNDLSAALESFSSQRQNQSAEQKTPVNVNVTVQIQEAHAWDSEHIQELSDRVADKIQPEIISAIGGDSNSY